MITIKPNDTDTSKEEIKVNLNDNSTKVSLWYQDDILNIDQVCYDEVYNNYAIYLYDQDTISNSQIENYLNSMIPSNLNIIDLILENHKNIKSISDINNILHKYHLNYEYINEDEFKNIRDKT